MTFRFDEKTHSYFLDDKRMTGVTSIIAVLAKPALIAWSARMCSEYIGENRTRFLNEKSQLISEEFEKILEEGKNAHNKKKEAAGEHGTDSHSLIEKYIGMCIEKNNGKPFSGEMDLRPIEKFHIWAVENVGQFLFSERRMFDKDLFIAGTCDFAYLGKDGKRYIADFKTSSGIYGVDYFLQVSAYKMLAEKSGDEAYDGMVIVRLGKKGDFEVQKLYEYETYRDAFLACLTLYRAQASIKEMVV